MRNLIYVINLSMDGCCDHTKMIPDEDLFEYHTNLVRNAGMFVYGRKTYQLMVPYWPDIVQLIGQHPALSYGNIFEIRPAGDMSEVVKASEQRRRQNAAR